MNLIHIFLAVSWDNIFQKIGTLFMGNETVNGIFGGGNPGGGDPILAGVFLFIILFILTAIWGLGMMIGSAVIIPITFSVFQFIPGLKIIVAIICGLVFGIALHKLVRR